MSLIIRPGTGPDHEMALEVWRSAQAARGQRPPAARVQRVAEKLREGILVLADDGRIVGMALGEPGLDGTRPVPDLLHVAMVCVAPHRQRTGVGSALLEGLADLAWDRGMRRISAWTRTDNDPARALYLACGLEPAGAQVLADGSPAVEFVGELEAPVRDVAVFSDGIRLGQFLKLAALVETGAQAKSLLAAGDVQVNGEPEDRRGRQLVGGDLVRAGELTVRVHLPR